MGSCPRFDFLQNRGPSVIGFDACEVSSLPSQLSEERIGVCGDCLSNHNDAQPGHGQLSRLRSGIQTLNIFFRRRPEPVHLVGGPKMSR